MKLKIQETQQKLKEQNLDGWLLYDFRGVNDLALNFLEVPKETLLTRRFFYWIPVQGTPSKIVQGIEDKVLDHLPGSKLIYQTWQDLEESLRQTLKGLKKVAMEYSPRNALPYLSKVDGGTVDLVRSFGIEVISSANLLQLFTSVWTEKKFKLHLEAANLLDQIADETWELLAKAIGGGKEITEYEVQQFILERFRDNDCIASDSPICAVNANSAKPHYTPSQSESFPIRIGDFILIDLWCKKNSSDAVYADITRVAFAGKNPSARQQEVFAVVRAAQKAATDFVVKKFSEKKEVHGWEVDRASRNVIEEAGFGKYFIHRTGHNIDVNDHGNGVHMDDYETHDERLLIPCTCFSIEPGIYLPGEFGIRLEYDLYIHQNGNVQITGGIQNEIVTLL